MHSHSLMSSLILFVFLLCISDSKSLKTLKNLAVKRGGSLSIPCVYDEKYKSNRKYWCKGYHWSSCKIVASTNTNGTTSVTDHPTQNMFTVELKSLQDSDSGYYWCAVEIGGLGTPDDKDYLYLTVSADPAVSVINSSVSGQEGGSVSIQCLYSAEYHNEQKKWCKFKDWSCYTAKRTNTSQNSAVLVTDYGKGSVSVEMRGLQKSDAGWYWFSAGDVGVTVHLTVTERPSNSTTMSENTETRTAELNGNTGLIWVLLAVGLGLLLILATIITCMLRKKCNGNQMETRERTLTTESPVIYSAVISKNKKPSSASDHENDVIYNNVTTTTENETLSQAVRDDAVIYSSVVSE